MSSQVIPYGGLNCDPQCWNKRSKRNPLGSAIAPHDKSGRDYRIRRKKK